MTIEANEEQKGACVKLSTLMFIAIGVFGHCQTSLAGVDFGIGLRGPDEELFDDTDNLYIYWDRIGRADSFWTTRFGVDWTYAVRAPEDINEYDITYSAIRARLGVLLRSKRLYLGAGPLLSYWKININQIGCCGGSGITYVGTDPYTDYLAAQLNGIYSSSGNTTPSRTTHFKDTNFGWHAFIGIKLFSYMQLEITHDQLPSVSDDSLDIGGTQIRLGLIFF